jgi:hypothetical protein
MTSPGAVPFIAQPTVSLGKPPASSSEEMDQSADWLAFPGFDFHDGMWAVPTSSPNRALLSNQISAVMLAGNHGSQ